LNGGKLTLVLEQSEGHATKERATRVRTDFKSSVTIAPDPEGTPVAALIGAATVRE
jgi:hypothetical protein